MRTLSKRVLWAGVGLVLAQGLLHLSSVQSGTLFVLTAGAAVAAAAGIYRGATWGWILGLTVTAGWLGLYIAIRAVGLFIADGDGSLATAVDRWFQVPGPGTLAWIVQGLYVLIFASAFGPSLAPSSRPAIASSHHVDRARSGRYRRALPS